MYQVRISAQASTRINVYTDSIMDYYERLYTDTGLGDVEEVIRRQCIDATTILNKTLHISIKEALQQDILWHSHDATSDIYTTTIPIGARRLFIEYREYPREKIRVVMDVQIIRR